MGKRENRREKRDAERQERWFRRARLRRERSNGERTRKDFEPRSRYVEEKGVMESRTRGVEALDKCMSGATGVLVEAVNTE